MTDAELIEALRHRIIGTPATDLVPIVRRYAEEFAAAPIDAIAAEQLAWEEARTDHEAVKREKHAAMLARERGECVACPEPNPDCQHPTCPRWPQPGHFVTEAAELVDAWETSGKGYGDLEQRIAVALAEAAKR